MAKNNRNPQKKKEQIYVAVAGVVLVISNLLHGAAWGDDQGFQLDFYHQRQTRHRSGDMGDKKKGDQNHPFQIVLNQRV
jgi:hypothetical protein